MIPIHRLSASSLNKFMRCPAQWHHQYILGNREPSNSSLLIGSAVHAYLSEVFSGENPDFDTIWLREIEEAREDGPINWRESEAKSRDVALAHAWRYWEQVGKYLDVKYSEQEIELFFDGVDVPVIGYVDIETADTIIDLKTTGYFKRNVKLNREWKFQMAIYQAAIPKQAEIHVLTRAKTDPLVLPDSTGHALSIPPEAPERVSKAIRDCWEYMNHLWETRGNERPWPGNPNHEWGSKYCPLPDCCGR